MAPVDGKVFLPIQLAVLVGIPTFQGLGVGKLRRVENLVVVGITGAEVLRPEPDELLLGDDLVSRAIHPRHHGLFDDGDGRDHGRTIGENGRRIGEVVSKGRQRFVVIDVRHDPEIAEGNPGALVILDEERKPPVLLIGFIDTGQIGGVVMNEDAVVEDRDPDGFEDCAGIREGGLLDKKVVGLPLPGRATGIDPRWCLTIERSALSVGTGRVLMAVRSGTSGKSRSSPRAVRAIPGRRKDQP